MAKEKIFLEINDQKSHVEITGSRLEIIAHLCSFFNSNPAVKALFKGALKLEEQFGNEAPKANQKNESAEPTESK